MIRIALGQEAYQLDCSTPPANVSAILQAALEVKRC